MTRNAIDNRTTRRAFLGGTAALAASAVLPRGVFGDAADKPNSVFNGVRVGCITYSYRGGPSTAEHTLDCLLKDGLSETELMDGPIRSFAGITGGGGRGLGRGDGGGKDAQQAFVRDFAAAWGKVMNLDRFDLSWTRQRGRVGT